MRSSTEVVVHFSSVGRGQRSWSWRSSGGRGLAERIADEAIRGADLRSNSVYVVLEGFTDRGRKRGAVYVGFGRRVGTFELEEALPC